MDELQSSQLKGFYSRFFLPLLLLLREKKQSFNTALIQVHQLSPIQEQV